MFEIVCSTAGRVGYQIPLTNADQLHSPPFHPHLSDSALYTFDPNDSCSFVGIVYIPITARFFGFQGTPLGHNGNVEGIFLRIEDAYLLDIAWIASLLSLLILYQHHDRSPFSFHGLSKRPLVCPPQLSKVALNSRLFTGLYSLDASESVDSSTPHNTKIG